MALLIDRDSVPNAIVMYSCLLVSLIAAFRVVRSITAFKETVLYIVQEFRMKYHSNCCTVCCHLTADDAYYHIQLPEYADLLLIDTSVVRLKKMIQRTPPQCDMRGDASRIL